MIIIIVTMNIKGFVMMNVLEQLLAELQDLKKQKNKIVVRYRGKCFDIDQKSEYTDLSVILQLIADVIKEGERDVKA